MPRMTSPARPKRLSQFWRDRRGVSAVEFALLAPVLVLFYCGMAELTQAMMAQRRLNHLASSVGDVVARTPELTDARLDDVFHVGDTLMSPFSTTKLGICLASIVSDATGKDTVDWSQKYPAGAAVDCPAKGAVVSIDAGVLPASQSVVMSKASYGYVSPLKFVMPAEIVFNRTLYLRPRLSDKITRVP
ncbi:TadE/TadG family type IV pilus assembly protein [Caulobacter sp. LARHSG274]